MGKPMTGTGPARRRTSVACARCRKKKIRCSGDPGNGLMCANCQQARVDPEQCQFHRVRSGPVQEVINERNHLSGMANSALYPRPMPTKQYPQLDTKPVYPSP
ncbi:hypothetical protein EJ07DRAFT_156466 [Lizonia empirigonia]|nr:hypothetical protein EJ07DRAFT_156466 [Lizonia empirigonia]